MKYNIGDKVSFFSVNEEFNHIKLDQIDEWVKGLSWYEVKDVGDDWLDVQNVHSDRVNHVSQVYDEYQVYNKEDLIQHLKTLLTNSGHAAIINKIRQLYRKQEFKFQGV